MTYDIKELKSFDSDVAKVCSTTKTWFSEDFIISFYADRNWKDKAEQCDTLIKMSKEFAKKWDFINEIPEPYEDEFQIYDSQTLTLEQLPDFIKDAQAIIDYAWDINASINIEATFIPEDGQKEKVLRLILDEKSKITVECCKREQD